MHKSLAILLFAVIALGLWTSPSTASADPITMDWSLVGDAGNAADPATGYGAVGYAYNIGTYDVTVNQYVAFLNSNDPTGANALGLYNAGMNSSTYGAGVSFNAGGASGGMYSAIGDGNDPMTEVDYVDTLRFANWLGNGQVAGSTETGSYTISGNPLFPDSVVRNSDASVFIPTADEWYKAAYYDPTTSSYFAYSTSSNTAPTASGPTSAPNSANYLQAVGTLTEVGASSGTKSAFGAYDLGGNVFQWNETLISSGERQIQGGYFLSGAFDNDHLLASQTSPADTAGESNGYFLVGFRVASAVSTPEPSSGVLAILACASLWWWKKRLK